MRPLTLLLLLLLGTVAWADDIHDAAWQGNLAKVKALLEANPALLEKPGHNGTPLITVCCSGYKGDRIGVVRYLLDLGAKVNAKNEVGSTALIGACAISEVEIIELLLDAGADVNARRQDGTTALGMALVRERQDVVKLLKARGATAK